MKGGNPRARLHPAKIPNCEKKRPEESSASKRKQLKAAAHVTQRIQGSPAGELELNRPGSQGSPRGSQGSPAGWRGWGWMGGGGGRWGGVGGGGGQVVLTLES